MTRNGKMQDVVSSELLTPIIFTGSGVHIVAGPESRQIYSFSSHDPEQMVDARDAEALLKTGLFRSRH